MKQLSAPRGAIVSLSETGRCMAAEAPPLAGRPSTYPEPSMLPDGARARATWASWAAQRRSLPRLLLRLSRFGRGAGAGAGADALAGASLLLFFFPPKLMMRDMV